MRLRSPAEFYIKALSVHPAGYSAEDIKERLLDEGLDFVSVPYLERVRKKLRPPKPFRPDDRRHMSSMQFVMDERINRFFQPDVAMKTALQVLNTPRAKEFAEAMLLVRVPLAAPAEFITRQRGVYCTVEALELYKHYFWNVDLLSAPQMRMLLGLRFDQAAELEPALKGRKSLVRSAYYKDALKVAGDMPFSPTTAILAQVRLGLRPSRLEITMLMREASNMGALRAVEAVTQDGPGDSQKFLNYASGHRIFEETLQMVAKPEDSMREQLQSIALRTDTRDVPSIHQLSAGQHTVDVMPMRDPNHDHSAEFESDAGDDGGGAGAEES